jgi:hypothetical protein
MREEAKLEAATEKEMIWPRSSTSSRPHTAFFLTPMSLSTAELAQKPPIRIVAELHIYMPAQIERKRRCRRMEGGAKAGIVDGAREIS